MAEITQSQRGFTLIELILSIAIIGVSILGLLSSLRLIESMTAQPLWQAQALEIADSYLAEASQHHYLDPDTQNICDAPEAQRTEYDNICDYNGLSNNGARDANDVAIPGLENYQIDVAVNQAATLGGTRQLSGAAQVLRIDVRVQAENIDITLSGYRSAD